MFELPLAEHDGTSVVLVGSFNPRIFQPSWFVRQGLLPKDVEAEADVQLINNDVCVFQSDWFRIEVLSDRFALSTFSAPVVEGLRDLVLGTFNILGHTPVTKLGLNTQAHFPLRDNFTWHQLGHRLAPKEEFWSPILDAPGTLTLTIQGERPDGHEGHIRVKVEPSMQVENGLFIETNDEFRMPDATSTEWLVDVLGEHWAAYRERSVKIREHLLRSASGDDQ